MTIPAPTRASLSGYISPGKLLPWQWVDTRMAAARNYWITTHSPAFPSSRPVWGIWRSPTLFFSTGSAVARHMARDPRIQVNLESGGEVVILEGRVASMPASEVPFWVKQYKEKYNWDLPETTDQVYAVAPARVLAWISDSSGVDTGTLFANTATEWNFT